MKTQSWSKRAGGLACAVLLASASAGDFVKAGTAVAEPTRGDSAGKPNIIVILVDDLGYADISAYYKDRFSTPNIDRIGQEGVRFTDGYASAPVCAPSRAGLMTGRYQERFGFEYNDGPAKRDIEQGLGVSTKEITIAQLLKQDGYHTGAIGKWHLGSQPQFYPMKRGFDEFVGFLPGQSSYINPHLPGVHAAFGPTIGDAVLTEAAPDAAAIAQVRAQRHIPASVSDQRIASQIEKIEKSFERGKLNQIIEGPDHTVVHNDDQYLTDYFGDRANEFIQRNSKAGNPYFLYLAFNAVHSPHMVTARYYDRFPQIKDHQLRVYAAMIAALDDQVGRVLHAVDASGEAGNTIVVFASDNGCAMYDPGLCSCLPLRGGKLSQYEGGTRIPFMIRWPGHIKPGTVYREPVSLLDVLPTSVAAAGGKLPTDRAYDGVNLLPYLDGKNRSEPHDVMFWRREPLFSIRKGDWKLWESVDDATGTYGKYKLLFNLKNDLNEAHNLAESRPDKVRELETLIHGWSKTMMDPQFPSKKPVTFDVCGRTFTLPI